MDKRILDRFGEEDFWVPHKELVERIVHADENGECVPRAAPGASGLLPQTGDRAGIADQDGGIQVADVDSQFQSVRRGHSEQVAVKESRFDLAAFVGEIAGAIGPDAVHGFGRSLFQVLAGVIEEQFGGFGISEGTLETIYTILNNYTRMNGDRRPEAVAPETFCFDENDEAGRELRRAESLEQLTKSCSALIPPERRAAFYGLVEFPALASANLRKMMIYVGMQRLFLKCGSSFANELAERIAECQREDEALIRHYNEEMADGKWNKMMSSKHIHFVNWNEEGSGCPPVHTLNLP